MIYYLSERNKEGVDAGNKARNDVEKILSKKKYRAISAPNPIKKRRRLNKLFFLLNNRIFLKQLKQVSAGSTVIVQYPFLLQYKNSSDWYDCSFILKKLSKTQKLVFIIHDIDKLRFPDSHKDMDILKLGNVLISHNENMTKFLRKNGFKNKKIINLKLFDYLSTPDQINDHSDDELICFAGNLKKSVFLTKLPLRLRKKGINLYGTGWESETEGINYKGTFGSEEISSIIQGKYGLIWDGNSIDTCDGVNGNYLRYNNPHKLSMYIDAAMPVIIWKDAAEANFVKEHNIGLLIESLNDINSVTSNIGDDSYQSMVRNVITLKKKINQGFFLNESLKEGLKQANE